MRGCYLEEHLIAKKHENIMQKLLEQRIDQERTRLQIQGYLVALPSAFVTQGDRGREGGGGGAW